MNGVVGVFNGSNNQIKYIESLHNDKGHALYSDNNCIIKLFYPAKRESKVSIFNNIEHKYDVILFGDVYVDDKKIIDPKVFVHNERANFNGEFIVIIIDKIDRNVQVYTDQICTNPMFYAQYSDSFVFSSFLPYIHTLIFKPKTMNAKSVHDFLAYGNCLGQDTFFRKIKRLLPGHVIHYKDKISVDKYRNETEEYTGNISQLQDEVTDALIKAIRKRIYSPNAILAMSGGLDSRFMLGILNKYFRNDLNINPIMWSQANSDEAFVAQQACSCVDKDLDIIELEAKDFIENYYECCEWHGGNDLVFQGFLHNIGNQIKEKGDMVFTGFTLDLSLGGTFTDQEIVSAKSLNFEFVERKRSTIKANNFTEKDFSKGLLPNINFFDYSCSLLDELNRNSFEEMGRSFRW